jgi:hypothetical protein
VSHHRLAAITIAAALGMAALLGAVFAVVTPGLPVWHGMFCGVANAVTDGCDLPPRTGPGYAVTFAEYLTAVPLWGATFALFTSWLASGHVQASEARIMEHAEDQLEQLTTRMYFGHPKH